jgi:hypothetical protein
MNQLIPNFFNKKNESPQPVIFVIQTKYLTWPGHKSRIIV